jgi:hypothetical protein
MLNSKMLSKEYFIYLYRIKKSSSSKQYKTSNKELILYQDVRVGTKEPHP